jgi:hypothetical protein
VLERAGLISRSQVATARYSHLEAEPLREANAYVERYRRFWNDSFDRLDTALAAYLAEERTSPDASTARGDNGAAGERASRPVDPSSDKSDKEH